MTTVLNYGARRKIVGTAVRRCRPP